MNLHLVALVAFINGLVISYICVCRLNYSSVRVMPGVRFKYVMLLTGSVAYGAQPILFNEWPTTGGTVLHLCITAGLISGFRRWKSGPPSDALKPEIQPQGR